MFWLDNPSLRWCPVSRTERHSIKRQFLWKDLLIHVNDLVTTELNCLGYFTGDWKWREEELVDCILSFITKFCKGSFTIHWKSSETTVVHRVHDLECCDHCHKRTSYSLWLELSRSVTKLPYFCIELFILILILLEIFKFGNSPATLIRFVAWFRLGNGQRVNRKFTLFTYWEQFRYRQISGSPSVRKFLFARRNYYPRILIVHFVWLLKEYGWV